MAKVDIFLIFPWVERNTAGIRLRLAEAQAYCASEYPNSCAYIEQWEGDTTTRTAILIGKFKWRPDASNSWRSM